MLIGRLGLALVAAVAIAPAAAAQPRVIDAFEDEGGWTAHPSDGVSLRISRDAGRSGSAMRLDFDFHGGAGYAIARREISLDLPDDYELAFWVRGDALPQNLELKLVDPSGENVWWINRRDFRFPRAWTRVTTRKRQIEFAWGPQRDTALTRTAAIEIAITAGSGGKGTVWLDDFTLTERRPQPPYPDGPRASASASLPGSDPRFAVDGDSATAWRIGAQSPPPQLLLDYGGPLEFSAVVLRWQPGQRATGYRLMTAAQATDTADWTLEAPHLVSAGDADFLYLPEREARFFRLVLDGTAEGTHALRELEVKPASWAKNQSEFFEQVAARSPPGRYPKYFSRRQSYWTIAGANGDGAEALINEEGMVEAQAGTFSIEPFLYSGNRLISWADASTAQRLEDGFLPIPSVRWDSLPVPLALDVTAIVAGARDSSTLWVRYRVSSHHSRPQRATLYLAARPFQVNPTWQFLNRPGGVGRISRLSFDGARLTVNDDSTVGGGKRVLHSVTRPTAFGAAREGELGDALARGDVPAALTAADESGWAAGVFSYELTVPPQGSEEVWIAVPLRAAAEPPRSGLAFPAAARIGDSVLTAATSYWRSALGGPEIRLPAAAEWIVRSLRSNLAYVLINRDGPSIQPGSRSYERSWIRDGALTSEALLRLGREAEVREFIEWYAPFQFADGKVPCCVDRRGADPVPENDSHGQLIYLIAEHWRFTGDTAFSRRMWPHVVRAVAYMDSLRHSRMTPIYHADSLAYYGLLPQSISHEGYSAKPMHSYWDDFFALKGFKDAAELALALGERDRAAEYSAMAAAFRRDLLASFARAMAAHAIDYLPGSVELGDFDATSTTVGISPGGELSRLPPAAVQRTFDRYWERFVQRRDADTTWDAYTPYEHRVTGTFIRLGQPDRAHALLEYFRRDQRPAGWNHWAEVVWRDPATPRFIGDMPHTWVGSDFIRSVLDLFAYERESDSTLVVGAGILPGWVNEAPGVSVRDLRTHYGALSYAMRRSGSAVHVSIGQGVRLPPGGIALRPPSDHPPVSVLVNEAVVPLSPAGEVIVRSLPAEIQIRY
ncbi:MAG TPA: discoidin domain-containing protein [Gemmatimonadaceae bacterium]